MRVMAMAAHELRNPLNAMVGYAELIALAAAGRDHSKIGEWSATIVDVGARLHELITNITDRARIETGDWQPRIDEVDVERTVHAAIDSLAIPRAASEVELRLHLSPCHRVHRTDLVVFSRVVSNLVGNALKYTDAGHVAVAVVCAGRLLRLEVEDTGIGIPQQDLEAIFVPFERGTHARALERSGSGLGLAVVRDFVRELGGDVSVETALDVGTRISVEIPAHE